MYQFAKHFIEQMQIRNIGMPEATDVLNHPQQPLKKMGLLFIRN